MQVRLPDKSLLELPDGASGLVAARSIGPRLAEQAVGVRVDGDLRDLRLPLADGQQIEILTTKNGDDADALTVLRHSAAHLLAEAVRRLYPGVKVAIGPAIATTTSTSPSRSPRRIWRRSRQRSGASCPKAGAGSEARSRGRRRGSAS
jgi:hypothetical protein